MTVARAVRRLPGWRARAHSPAAPSDTRGFALVDAVCVLALAGVLTAMAIPPVGAWMAHDRARLVARHVAGVLARARMEALVRNRAVGVRFEREGSRYVLRTYVDGNGTGVRTADVAAGIDRPLAETAYVPEVRAGAGLGIVTPVPEPGGRGAIAAGADPVHVGRSRIVSFSAVGTCTSGTIFVASGSTSQAAVRVLGSTGRVRVLVFDRPSATWRQE